MSESSTVAENRKTLTRNELALIRTGLANQRTYLALVRSGFAAIGLGIKFESNYPILIGIGFVVSGIIGYYRLKSTLSQAGANHLDSFFLEVVVFASLAIIYMAFQSQKK